MSIADQIIAKNEIRVKIPLETILKAIESSDEVMFPKGKPRRVTLSLQDDLEIVWEAPVSNDCPF